MHSAEKALTQAQVSYDKARQDEVTQIQQAEATLAAALLKSSAWNIAFRSFTEHSRRHSEHWEVSSPAQKTHCNTFVFTRTRMFIRARFRRL